MKVLCFFFGIFLLFSTNGQQLDCEDEIKALNDFVDLLKAIRKLYPDNQTIQYFIEKIETILETLLDNPVPLTEEERIIIDEFSQTFNITFSSEHEKKQAAEILAKANASITKNNELYAKGEGNFASKLYEFSHLTYAARFQKWLGLIRNRGKNLISLDSPTRAKRSTTFVSDVDLPIECANIPDSINWAEKKKTCPVQNQGGCGCCYIFSAIAAVESAVSIEYNSVPVKLSAQHNLECMKNFTDGVTSGCDGGNSPKVWNLGKEQGGFVAESLHYSYNGNSDGQCVASLKRDPKTHLDHWEAIPAQNEKAMKCRIALHGPISISIAVGESSIMNYEQGVWDDPDYECNGIPNDHAVLLVGYGTTTNFKGLPLDYWIVQNSWGAKWGESGFVRMLRNQNLCGIGEEPQYPILKTSPSKPLTPIKAPTYCLKIGQVYIKGVYVKSYCVDNYGQTYDDAQENGFSQGMKLYNFDSTEATSTLINGISLDFFDYSDIYIRVNGKGSTLCSNINNVNRSLKKFSNGTSNCFDRIRTAYEFIDVAYYNQNATTKVPTVPVATTKPATVPITTTKVTTVPVSTKLATTTKPSTLPVTTAKATTVPISTKPATTTKLSTFPPSTTRAPLSTTPSSSNTISCSDLFNSMGGYVETACLFGQKMNHSQAETYCRYFGMDLYNASTADSQTALFNYASTIYPDPSASLHIKGQASSQCQRIAKSNSLFGLKLGSCSDLLDSFCGYEKNIVTVKTTTTTTTAPLSEGSVTTISCLGLNDAIGNQFGSACFIANKQTYSQAKTFCQNFGMDLYDATTADSQTALFNYANTLNPGPTANLHINGQASSQCKRISKNNGTFGVQFGSCNDLLDSFCGY